jgi:diaminopimelate decarboxylase
MPALIDVLAVNGCGFDCASAAEIQLALDAGVSPERIIFAHPAKRPYAIPFAILIGLIASLIGLIASLIRLIACLTRPSDRTPSPLPSSSG